ncbi:hypothetical protein RP75_23995 [Agrobacterium arsenijevicii]|uniref:Uncharacterized protein n=1 Tax=Agrobacterium arsenijevicii TaxID=1585697 RepID=A0ABR5D1F8_9HYPH|nr:hypothetical protein RP75_23995 [Agrobacterium arsenijevicii]
MKHCLLTQADNYKSLRFIYFQMVTRSLCMEWRMSENVPCAIQRAVMSAPTSDQTFIKLEMQSPFF